MSHSQPVPHWMVESLKLEPADRELQIGWIQGSR